MLHQMLFFHLSDQPVSTLRGRRALDTDESKLRRSFQEGTGSGPLFVSYLPLFRMIANHYRRDDA
jgi:hypothetical protein